MRDLFAMAVTRLVDYHYKDEERHYFEMASEEGCLENDKYSEDAVRGHVFHDVHQLRKAGRVTLHRVMTDDSLRYALDRLLSYFADDEADSFSAEAGLDNDSTEISIHQIMGVEFQNMPHIFQTISYLSDELCAADLEEFTTQLGEAIEDGDPQTIADRWLAIKGKFTLAAWRKK